MRRDGLIADILDASTLDAAAIWEIQRLAFHQQAILYNDFKLPPLVQTLEELTQDFELHTFLKAINEKKIIGSVRGKAEGTTCHISRLMVHPDYQDKGIGKMLMLAIEEKFGDAQRFELFTGHKSGKNLALYVKLGYCEYKRIRQSSKVTLICMEKRKV